jgi:hypothetical protein
VDDNLLAIVLVVLTFATALNLFLLLRLAERERARSRPLLHPVGAALPAFEARRLADGTRLGSADIAGRPLVLVFLSGGCPACKAALPELESLLTGAAAAGVGLWIVTADAPRAIALLALPPGLAARTLTADRVSYRKLNPHAAAPAYLFLDETMVVRASNYVGDADWRSFVEQMREIERDRPADSPG